jgi:hypothetical protein
MANVALAGYSNKPIWATFLEWPQLATLLALVVRVGYNATSLEANNA